VLVASPTGSRSPEVTTIESSSRRRSHDRHALVDP
jgi:hypothetical protein